MNGKNIRPRGAVAELSWVATKFFCLLTLVCAPVGEFPRVRRPTAAGAPRLRPGTRLVRQWGDQVHLVNVQTNGYEYQGNRYRSLSEIARLITGTRWSGPLFFGIKRDSANAKSEEVQ